MSKIPDFQTSKRWSPREFPGSGFPKVGLLEFSEFQTLESGACQVWMFGLRMARRPVLRCKREAREAE
eukprot:7236709-Lingulodinium_polyedra.AAC.1